MLDNDVDITLYATAGKTKLHPEMDMDLQTRPAEDLLIRKTEDAGGGNQEEHWNGRIVRSGLEGKMKKLKRAGQTMSMRQELIKKEREEKT